MAPDTTSTAKTRKYAWFALPLAALLLGAGLAYVWSAELARVSSLNTGKNTQENKPLRVIATRSLYMDEFKAPEVLPQVWLDTQNILAIRPEIPRTAPLTAQKAAQAKPASFMARLLLPLSPVQTAQASTAQSHAAVTQAVAPPAATGAATITQPAAAPVQQGVQRGVQQGAQKATPAPTQRGAAPAVPATAPRNAASQSTGQATGQATGQGAGQNVGQNAGATNSSSVQKGSSDFLQAFNAGSLGQMTLLRAELEQLKMQVTIEETRQRLNQLRGSGGTALRRSMPSLDMPPLGISAPTPRALRILSIQSVNGKYTATINSPSGPRVVKVNDAVGGGRVVSITRNSVVLNRGQGNETLSIQD